MQLELLSTEHLFLTQNVCNRVAHLLSGRVPDLQLDLLAVQLHRLDLEVDAYAHREWSAVPTGCSARGAPQLLQYTLARMFNTGLLFMHEHEHRDDK